MTLNWIGTRTQDGGVFNPDGIDCAPNRDPVGLNLLTRGSVMIEATVRPRNNPVNLLRFGALDPWPSGLTICLEPDGTVRLLMRQGSRHLETALRTTLGSTVQTAHITYVWDAPARKGYLSAHIPDHGTLWQTEVVSPFPLSLRDAKRIMTDPQTAKQHKTVSFAAVADAPCPLGPLPGLSGSAFVDTPRGPRPIRDIVAGDYVNVQHGGPTQVLWAGQTSVPALGRFAPMTLRCPYLGLWDDVVMARDQRACLSGSEVEYLFGEERVSTAVRHLEARNCAEPTRPKPPIMTYHQILLPAHDIITVNGGAFESFDGSAVLESPALLKTSVLADIPAAMVPRDIGLIAPVLQGYEALTLTGVTFG